VRLWSIGEYIADGKNHAKRAIFFNRRRVSPVASSVGLIEGATFDEAYSRLELEAGLAANNRVNDLMVRVEDGGSVAIPPSGYPTNASGEGGAKSTKLDEWFREITAWWQSPLIEAPERMFTHGRRLRLYDGKQNADQLKAIAGIIQRDRIPTNGRAIATLIDPEIDTLAPEAGRPTTFPAFCLLQLHIRNDGKTEWLDATAYFRKQEMRYWWPVNIAEVGFIMSKVVGDMKGIKIGSITTVTAIAVWEPSRSRVAIPKIERLYLQDHEGRTTLSRMAALLSDSSFVADDMKERKEARQMWRVVLDDLVPPSDAGRDNIPVAVEGLSFLRRSVSAQLAVSTSEPVKIRLSKVVVALEHLEKSGVALRSISANTGPGDWKSEFAQHLDVMSNAKEELSQLVLGDAPD
jgi:hypothetical protein